MNNNSIRPDKKVLKYGRIILVIFGFAIIVLILFLLLYKRQNNILIQINNDNNKEITLATNIDFSDSSHQLVFENARLSRETTFHAINLEHKQMIKDTSGFYQKPFVLGYTFYLKNQSLDNTIDQVDYYITLSNIIHEVDQGLRIMVIQDDDESIYEKNPLSNNEFDSIKFVSQTTAVYERLLSIKPQQIVKFSIILWLDGQLTNDSMLGGSLDFQMNFYISDEN